MTAPLTAGQLMSTPLITLERDTPLRDAATILTENRITGAVVTDYAGKPLGVVSMFDIVTYLAGLERPAEEPGGFYRYAYPKFKEGGEGWEEEWEEVEVSSLREVPVAEVMTPDILSVPEDEPIEKVAQNMWKRHVHRLFVGRNGVPVGVISTMDVLKALTGGGARRAARRAPPKRARSRR